MLAHKKNVPLKIRPLMLMGLSSELSLFLCSFHRRCAPMSHMVDLTPRLGHQSLDRGACITGD